MKKTSLMNRDSSSTSSILRSDPEAFEGDEVIIYPEREELEKWFSYKIRPTDLHMALVENMEIYIRQNELFMRNKNRRAARKARKALAVIRELCRPRRIEMLQTYKHPEYRHRDFRGDQ